MSKVLVFGGTGGIGSAVVKAFKHKGDEVISLGRKDMDLSVCTYQQICDLLEEHLPDVVVHSAGVIKCNHPDKMPAFINVNYLSAHYIALYYINNLTDKPANVTYVGSSSHDKSSPRYVLYASMKSALNNMVNSLSQLVYDNPSPSTRIYFNLVHPCKTKTKMRLDIAGPEPAWALQTPEVVAKEIVRLSMQQHGGEITNVTLESV